MTLDNNYTLIYNMFRKMELDIIKIAWGSLVTNTQLDDLFIDDFSNHEGINNSLSYYNYDPSYKYVYKTDSQNLSIIMNSWSASLLNPTSAYCALEIYPPEGGYTLNSDILIFISTDNGTHYEEFTNLFQIYEFQSSNIIYLRGEINSLLSYDDNRIVFKIQCDNDIDIKISAIAVGVRYQ